MSNNRKKIVITGASGFLGRNLVEQLKENESYYVYALSSKGEELQKNNNIVNLRYCNKEAAFTGEGVQMLNEAVVINCAFPRNSTGTGMADGLKYIQRLFESICNCKARAIINISSQSVYSSRREKPATEETSVCLETPYAIGKYAAELMLESACRKKDINYTNLRMASLIGPGFDQRIVNRFIKQVINGRKLRVTSGNQVYGFLDVKDAVSGISSIIRDVDHFPWNKIYNLGSQNGYSLEQIAQSVCHVGADYYTRKIIYLLERSEDIYNSMIDSNSFMTAFRWCPKISIEDSVKAIFQDEVKKSES